MNDMFEKRTFEISKKDAAKIIVALELDASWDKTEIYYEHQKWFKEKK